MVAVAVSLSSGPVWCYWRASSFMRRDHAFVAMPHDASGETVASYWLAWPPYIEAGIEKEVLRHRFATSCAAMDYADRTWPL